MRRVRTFSAHSARRWFATALMLAGVHEKMIALLMRHISYVGDRYKDPPLDAMAQALTHLPRLFGPQTSGAGGLKTISDSSTFPLARGEDGRYGVSSSANAKHPTNLNDVPGLCVAAFAEDLSRPVWAGNDVELFGQCPDRAESRRPAPLIQTNISGNPIGVAFPETRGLKNAVADLTRAFARVIEEITRGGGV